MLTFSFSFFVAIFKWTITCFHIYIYVVRVNVYFDVFFYFISNFHICLLLFSVFLFFLNVRGENEDKPQSKSPFDFHKLGQ